MIVPDTESRAWNDMTETLTIDEVERDEAQAGSAEPAVCSVLDVPIHVMSMASAIAQVNRWIAETARPRLITFVNVHMAVEARLRPGFLRRLEEMDLNCPDGAPIYWLTRRGDRTEAEKVSGPEFMPLFCEQSVKLGHTHFLYGGAGGVAEETAWALQNRYPGIRIAGHYCPPFRAMTSKEMDDVAALINASGADVVWVCLGCPKQEQWMAEMRDRLTAKVVLAVGQAFELVAGRRQRAPRVFRRVGLEWAYRLSIEPRRLWKRYLVTNLLFLLFLLRESLDMSTSEEASVLSFSGTWPVPRSAKGRRSTGLKVGMGRSSGDGARLR